MEYFSCYNDKVLCSVIQLILMLSCGSDVTVMNGVSNVVCERVNVSAKCM